MAILDVFEEFVKAMKEATDNNTGRFKFKFQKIGFLSDFSNFPLARKYPADVINAHITEVIELVKPILENNTENFLATLPEEVKNVTNQKIDIINELLVTEKLRSQYRFLSSSIGRVLDTFQAQVIIKPDEKPVIGALVKLNFEESASEESISVSFETNKESLDNLINGLIKVKAMIEETEARFNKD